MRARIIDFNRAVILFYMLNHADNALTSLQRVFITIRPAFENNISDVYAVGLSRLSVSSAYGKIGTSIIYHGSIKSEALSS